jgi:hypothetical protein
MDSLFLRIGYGFGPADYLFWTKMQLAAWSIADVALVFAVLRIIDIARSQVGKRRITIRYVFLAISAGLTLLAFVAETSGQIFAVEAVVIGMQFMILIYSIAVDRRAVLALLLLRCGD